MFQHDTSRRERASSHAAAWGKDVKFPVATCSICDEPICVELPDTSASGDPTRLGQEFEAAAEEHLRTHPKPVLARFWLRRFLDDMRPSERALAVKQVYSELLALWGDQDSRGIYSIDEALGTSSMYRLWVAANRCSYRACRHAAESRSDSENRSPGHNISWPRELLGRILPPPHWKGTSREWRKLSNAVADNCTCSLSRTRSAHCSAHQMLDNSGLCGRLLFGRRMASRLQREEFVDTSVPLAAAPDPAHAT